MTEEDSDQIVVETGISQIDTPNIDVGDVELPEGVREPQIFDAHTGLYMPDIPENNEGERTPTA